MNNFIRVSVNTHEPHQMIESCVRLYPLVCMHVGAPQYDHKFLTEHVKRIAEDPNARWIYMGDGGECVTRYSKGDIFQQLVNPQLQVEILQDILEPIRGKGLFGIRGNHGHRVYRETGLSFDHTLCHGLGIPFLGAAAMLRLSVNRSVYSMYFHHGSEGGTSLTAKIGKAEGFARFIMADAIFTAHSHVAMELQPATMLYADHIGGKVSTLVRHQYICGCAYDSRAGYAEDKGYPPLLPGYISVEFDGRLIEGIPQKNQRSTVYRSNGTYPLHHEYITKYIEAFNLRGSA